MEISLDQLKQLADVFKNPDPAYAGVAEAMHRMHARTPAERRADLERWLSFAAELEVGGGPWAKHAGVARRLFARELFCGRITDGTEFHR